MTRARLAALVLSLALCPACTCARKDLSPSQESEGADVVQPGLSEEQMKCPAALVAARKGGADPERYVVPSDGERSAIRDVAEKLLGGAPRARQEASLAAAGAGFEIVDVAEIPGAVLLREVEDKRRGGGAYLFRIGGAPKLLVQAPHTFFDEGTLPLACELFQRGNAAALFIDTAHRYKSAEANEDSEHPADVAHATTSLFQAATEGALKVAKAPTVIQLHGFAPRKTGARVVVSSGEKKPGVALVGSAQQALKGVVGDGVLRFPEDTSELGATTNVQGQIVRQSGGRFLHVEIEAKLRRDLLSGADLRARFLDALTGVLAAP